jgi:hypothetical protein
MNQTTMSPLSRVKNPAGRVDWLAAKIIEELAKKRGGLTQDIHTVLQPDLERFLIANLGPRNPHVKAFRQYLAKGQEILRVTMERRMRKDGVAA